MPAGISGGDKAEGDLVVKLSCDSARQAAFSWAGRPASSASITPKSTVVGPSWRGLPPFGSKALSVSATPESQRAAS